MGKIQKKKDPRKKKKQVDQNSASSSDASSAKAGLAVKSGFGAMARNKKKPGAISQRAAKKEETTGIQKVFNDAVQFLREVRVELKKVTWPSRKQTVGSTAVVLVLVMIVAFFLGIVDLGLGKIIQVVLG